MQAHAAWEELYFFIVVAVLVVLCSWPSYLHADCQEISITDQFKTQHLLSREIPVLKFVCRKSGIRSLCFFCGTLTLSPELENSGLRLRL